MLVHIESTSSIEELSRIDGYEMTVFACKKENLKPLQLENEA